MKALGDGLSRSVALVLLYLIVANIAGWWPVR